jgi:hypothetical protein
MDYAIGVVPCCVIQLEKGRLVAKLKTAKELREKDKERAQRYRERLKEKGGRQITVILSKQALEDLEELQGRLSGVSRNEVFKRVLRVAVIGRVPIPRKTSEPPPEPSSENEGN